jgi:hypothetical protein
MDFIQQFRWRPDIGDPSLMGWLTVAAYALTVITALAAARRAGRAPGLSAGSRAIWLAVAALMTFLCLNKQLDLQSLLTDIGRILSSKQGWYEQRREFQKWFVLGVLAASLLGTLFLLIRFRPFWKNHLLLGSGLFFLLSFIVFRAVSIHHFDTLIGKRFENPESTGFIELGGIALIWLAAIRDYRNPRKAPKPPWKPAA